MQRDTSDVLHYTSLRLYRYFNVVPYTRNERRCLRHDPITAVSSSVRRQEKCSDRTLRPVSCDLPSCCMQSSPNRDPSSWRCHLSGRSRTGEAAAAAPLSTLLLFPPPSSISFQAASSHIHSYTRISTHTSLTRRNVQLWLLRRTAPGRAASVPAAVLRPATRRRQGLWRARAAGIRHATANAVWPTGRSCVCFSLPGCARACERAAEEPQAAQRSCARRRANVRSRRPELMALDLFDHSLLILVATASRLPYALDYT